MPTPLTFDIFLDTTGPMAPCRLLTSADSSQPAVLPALVQADKLTVRLWLVVPATTIGAAATTLTHTGSIALAIKADQSDTDLLALCTSFSVATVGGLTCYTGELNLNTAAMATAFTSPAIDTINAWFDVELSNGTNRQTFQNRVAIYREVYNGTQPPPEDLTEWPAPSSIMLKPPASPNPAGYFAVFNNSQSVVPSTFDEINTAKRNDTIDSDGDYVALFHVAGDGSVSTLAGITSFDSTHTRIVASGLVRGDVDQTAKSEAWKAQARANIGVTASMPHGGVAASSGTMAPSSTVSVADFEAWFIRPSATSGTLLKVTHGGGTYSVAASDSRFGSAVYCGVGYVASTGVLTLYADGTAHATTTALTAGNVTLSNVLDAATCELVGGIIANRALTTNERTTITGGGFPSTLNRTAALGANFVNSHPYGGGQWSGFTSSGSSSFSATTSSSGAGAFSAFPTSKVGDKIRLSATVNAVTGTPVIGLSTPGGVSTAGAVWTIISGSNVSIAGNAWDLKITGTGSFVAEAYVTDATMGVNWTSGASSSSINVSGIVMRIVGLVARYDNDQVTSLGRWLDSSGNGYDLIPGSGITPLKPQPVQVRMEQCRYDLTTSTATDAPAGWTLAKTGTGVLTITPPAYVYGIKPPVVTCSSALNSDIVDVVVNQSTGVFTINSRSAGNFTDTVLYIHTSHRE